VLKSLVVLCLSAVCLLAPATAHAGGDTHHESDPIIAKINAVRASHGLRALRSSPSLSATAKRFSRHVIRTDVFAHDSTIHASSRFTSLGETLAIHPGWRPRRSFTVRSWLNSPGHRVLLLSPSFRYIGAGMARGRFGSTPTTIWTVQLGSR
jgi:uncharacterized protein YkwD